ncbi:hypothetical protein FDP41_010587 [Naegleria fowleri]|uniref:Uncharacterized protein n=1 Tax=Naegleria fowleri TaxID=5763 RepID=A0A6A5C990_NAEFO|nr:uncharacterized protein FDP41_010587 [Naegleria fowleri]KAF0983522.1 hypothetical protein FDP41_010587 [Naegleria fowleri]
MESMNPRSLATIKIKLLIRTWKSIHELRKKQEKEKRFFTSCPMIERTTNSTEPNTLLQKQTVQTFKKKFKNTILNELEKNEQVRRKQTMVDKLRKIDYYDRKNQQSKWSTLYSDHTSDSGMEQRFFDLENVEKEIQELVHTYNDLYHKSQKAHKKLEWSEPLFESASSNSQVFSAPFDLSSSQQKASSTSKSAPPLMTCLEGGTQYFISHMNVDSSNLFEDENEKIDHVILNSCLHDMEMLKKLRQINPDISTPDDSYSEDREHVVGSVFIRMPVQVSGEEQNLEDKTSYKLRPIRFRSKLQQLRETILSHE